MTTKKKYAAIVTLGCRLNTADSALMTARLVQAGYEMAESNAPHLDLAVLNTCAVTQEAVRKSRAAARKLRREHPGIRIIGVGCATLLEPEFWRKNHLADIVSGQSGKRDFQESPERPFEPVFSESANPLFPFRSRAFLKIQEGCNNFCTYCIVPYVRGRERSRAFDEVLSDARSALAAGFHELVLTGVNTCAYCDGGRTLGELVRAVSSLPGDFRIRLSSTEPELHNRELLEVMADPKNRVCRFLHLSLQHGCDRILQAMHRRYTAQEYADFVHQARQMISGIHIGTDFIVGFPGETEEDFAEGAALAKSLDFANMHIFPYSRRAGTLAADYPDQIPGDVVQERARRLHETAESMAKRFANSFQHAVLPVIFEEKRADGLYHGWSDNYLEVAAEDAPLDVISQVKIQRIEGRQLFGTVIQ